MSVDWKKPLLLLMILLVCSVKPITALEIKQVNSTSDSYTYAQLYSVSRNILSEFTEAEDVELTLEQSAYLESHQGGLRTKAEYMLYDVQGYLDYLLQESARYENTLLSGSHKRSESNIFTTDLQEMVDYLNNGQLNNMPINIPVEIQNCNYTNLKDYVHPENNNTPVYDKDKVIVQIRDGTYCIRYMELIDINGTHIHLKSGSEDRVWSCADFNSVNVWNDNFDSNSDRKFNVIIVLENYSRDHVLRLIWDKQDSDLIERESRVSAGSLVLTSALGTAGIAVASAGLYKLVDMCRGGRQDAQQARRVVDEAAGNAVAEVVPAPPQAGEAEPLFGSIGSFVNVYGVAEVRLNQLNPQRHDKSVVITACTVLAGILTAVGSAVALFYLSKLNGDYKKEYDNLKKYEPQIAK